MLRKLTFIFTWLCIGGLAVVFIFAIVSWLLDKAKDMHDKYKRGGRQ